MRTPYVLAGLLVAVVALALGWVILAGSPRDAGAGTLRALYAIEPPFAFVDSHGRVTGEAPEVLRIVARRAGFRDVEFVHAEFGQLLHDLMNGRAEVVASGLFVTPERARSVRFTRPTARVGTGLVVATGNPLDLHGLDDVAAHPEAVLAVVDGAVEMQQARRAGVPAARLQRHVDANGAVVAVIEGRADALALSDVSIGYMLASSGYTGIEAVAAVRPPQRDGRDDPGWPAFALRIDDEALARRLDEALAGFLGSAEHRALVARFGFAPHNLAAEVRP